MTAVTTSFDTFLENIRLPKELRDECQKAHVELRAKLMADSDLQPIIVSTFLQGSYRRNTGTKPYGDDGHVDVDVVVVTTLDPRRYTPDIVVTRFTPFLGREYPGQWEPSDRSIKISPTDYSITLDMVITAAPSEVETELIKAMDPEFQMEARGELDRRPVLLSEAFERLQKAARLAQWQREPLLIPSRDLKRWVPTHPLEQIRWTAEKNDRTQGHYVNVVKAVKWWRKLHPAGDYPKGYPLEHLVGNTCPNDIETVANGVTRVFEQIRDNYRMYVVTGSVPEMPDRGVPAANVFRRITPEQFATFWKLAEGAADEARAALDAETNPESAQRWRNLLGNEFPEPVKPFTPPTRPASATLGGRFG
jgi:hypothetical protein